MKCRLAISFCRKVDFKVISKLLCTFYKNVAAAGWDYIIDNKLTCGDRSSSSISLSYSCSPLVGGFEFVAMINGVLEKSTDSNTLEDGLLFFFMVILWIEVDLASSEGLSLKLDTKLVFAKLL